MVDVYEMYMLICFRLGVKWNMASGAGLLWGTGDFLPPSIAVAVPRRCTRSVEKANGEGFVRDDPKGKLVQVTIFNILESI